MPKLKNVERIIANMEGFEVTIRHADGREMRADKEGLPQWANGEMGQWEHSENPQPIRQPPWPRP
jgi:hypothetical protein